MPWERKSNKCQAINFAPSRLLNVPVSYFIHAARCWLFEISTSLMIFKQKMLEDGKRVRLEYLRVKLFKEGREVSKGFKFNFLKSLVHSMDG